MKHLLIVTLLVSTFAIVLPAPTLATAPTPTEAAVSALATAELDNPLKTDDVRVMIGRIIKAILGISGGLALLMFIWGGLIWMTSQGEKSKIEKGQKTLSWAVIGLAILFVAYAAVNWVIKALEGSAG